MGTITGQATAADGTEIGHRSAGEGDNLLLVHSTASDTRQWKLVVPLLAAMFTVVSMDRRGRGMSGPLRPDHSLETEYGDIAAVENSLTGPLTCWGTHRGPASPSMPLPEFRAWPASSSTSRRHPKR